MANETNLRAVAAAGCSVIASLNIAPDFTGRVIVHVRDGRAICDYRLMPDEAVFTLQGFLELASAAGWKVKPPAGETL